MQTKVERMNATWYDVMLAAYILNPAKNSYELAELSWEYLHQQVSTPNNVAGGLILGATLAGYIAFATFLVDQTMFVAMLAAALYLIDVVGQEGAEELLRPSAAIGRGLMTTIGLRREALEQIVVLVQGFVRLAIVVAAILLVLGPWSVSQDLTSTLRAAYFGLKIGGVTLSLSSLIAAAAALVVVLAATRAIQNWLAPLSPAHPARRGRQQFHPHHRRLPRRPRRAADERG